MSETKVILLCNNRIAIPAIQELNFYGTLGAVIIPAANKDVLADVEFVLKDSTVPVLPVTKKTLAKQVEKTAAETKAVCALLMTFPYRLDAPLLEILPRGFFNFHYGTLPKYRGPEPIFAQLKNGERTVSVTVHRVNEVIDAGPVIMEEKIRLEPEDTYGMVQSKMAWLGARLSTNLVKTLGFSNTLPSKPQDESLAGYQQKPELKDVLIQWVKMNSDEIRSLVNACNPWNKGAGTKINNYMIALLEVEITAQDCPENISPGTIVSLNSGGLFVATLDKKILKINIIYCPEGFMSGYRVSVFGIKEGDRFE